MCDHIITTVRSLHLWIWPQHIRFCDYIFTHYQQLC